MAGLKDQQRIFADYILEGKSQLEAHKLAGYKGKNDNARTASASEILKNPNVQDYLAERRSNVAQSTEITLEWLVGKAKGVLEAAQSDAAYGPAVSAIKEIGVLTGLRVEKRDNTNRTVTDVADLGPDEIDALLARELAAREEEEARSSRQSDSVH